MGNNQIAMGNNQIAMGNNQIANGICPSPSGEVRWGLDVDMLSNNFYIRTKTNIRSNLFLPFGKVRMGLRVGVADVITPLSSPEPSPCHLRQS